jgi:anaerobic selenocysteine-containing dehydrogenase
MDRREFLKGGVFAATAGLALDACAPDASQLIPILIPEEPFVPGEQTWTRTTCFECSATCGIEVRRIDGRLVKVEGNPEHPVSRGGLCARGQATPQAMYHPDRIQTPLEKQSDGSFAAIGWEEALDRIAAALGGDNEIAFLTGAVSGHRREIVLRFLQSFGSTRHLIHDPFGLGNRVVNDVDIETAGYVVSFGAELLESHGSPVRFGRGLASLRQGRPGRRGKFVMIGPRLSLTAANADEWIPARPGDELEIALGVAHVLIREGLHEGSEAEGFDEFRSLVEMLEPSAEAERIALEMAQHRPAIAIAGRGAALATAASHLNALLGTHTTAVSAPPFAPWPEISGDAAQSTPLSSALGDSPPGVLFVADTNPVYSLPSSFEAADWLASIPVKVSFASILDETSAQCDLVLPESMSFERFEDAVPAGAPVPAASLSQPLLVRALYDTRSMPDALIEIAKRSGHDGDFPWTSYEAALRAAWSSLGSWSQALARGGWWDESQTAATGLPTSYRFDTSGLVQFDARPRPELELHVYPSTPFGDGRSAHLPFLQELADPITGARWGSVVEIATELAESLGIASGDPVEVSSEFGTIAAPAWITPGIHPNVVAIAAGQGHTEYGRYATGRGVNAYTLLGRTDAAGMGVSIRKVSA